MLLYLNHSDYADLFDSFMEMYLPISNLQSPALLANGKYKWHGWSGMKTALQAWKAWGGLPGAVVEADGVQRYLTAAEQRMCAGPALNYFTEKFVSIGGVKYTAVPELDNRKPSKVRDSVVMTASSPDEVPFFGIVRQVLLFRAPGAAMVGGSDSAKSQHTEVVLRVDWLQPAPGSMHSQLHTPILKAADGEVVLMPANVVSNTFAAGRYISAQQVYPTQSVVAPISESVMTVLHRDPQVTALTEQVQRLRLC